MKIHSFIFTWNDYWRKAEQYEKILSPLSFKVTVINGTPTSHPHWIHLDDGYFTEQWNTACDNFSPDADVLFHIQADAEFSDFDKLFNRASDFIQNRNCGVYAPNIDYTAWVYSPEELGEQISPNVYEVQDTDDTCWFLRASIIREFPRVSPSINKYGWFIDHVAHVLCRRQGLRYVRDYSFTVKHPYFTGYKHEEARTEFVKTIQHLGLQEEVIKIIPRCAHIFTT